MKYWLITDTHFNHLEKMKLYCGRPENYEQLLFDSMRQIPKEDILIHLGDICIGNDAEVHDFYIKPLTCNKVLVRGNHDPKSDSWYLEHGWDLVCDWIGFEKHGKKLSFTHKPHPPREGVDLNIHGHFHNATHHDKEFKGFYDPAFNKKFAVEDTGYKAVQLEKFLYSLEK